MLCRQDVEFPKNVKRRELGKWAEGSAIIKPVLVNWIQFLYIRTVWYYLLIWPHSCFLQKNPALFSVQKGQDSAHEQAFNSLLSHHYLLWEGCYRGGTEALRKRSKNTFLFLRPDLRHFYTSDLIHHQMCHFSCLATAPAATGSVTMPARLSQCLILGI